MKWLLPVVIGAAGVSLAGQQPVEKPPRAEPSDTRIILEVNRVNMLFTVTDKKGKFITDLAKDDFQVVENKRPQSIQEFTAESDLPLRIAILIDTSNSIRDRFRFDQQAAADFITSGIRPRQDKAMVVSFDSSAELVSDLIDDPEKLAPAVRSLPPRSATPLYDALEFARRPKLQQHPPRHQYRPAVSIVYLVVVNHRYLSRTH